MNRILPSVWISVCLLASGCTAVGEDPERPALIAEHSRAGLQELQAALSEAYHGAKITLADTAFADSSYLLIERRAHTDGSGRLIMGNDPGRPDRFQLLVRGEECILVDLRDQRRWTLQEVRCQPLPE